MKILLIDDSWEFTDNVKYLLENDGRTVSVIDETDEAYDAITKENLEEYDIVILDLMFTVGEKFALENLPEVGIYLYRKIRKINKKIPIVIVSALNKKRYEKYFEGDTLVQYVSKPLSSKIEELEMAIKTFCP